MNNPVFALAWESWRLSRRWYLWVLPVAFALDYLIMRQASNLATRPQGRGPVMTEEVAAVLIAPGAFMINFMLAMFATLLAISLGNKSGFPLSFEFRLPVRTSLLVAVPMATLAALCASLYVLPILVVRLVYGVPIPLLPGATLIAALVVILLACGWSTSGSSSRTFAMLIGMIVASQLFALLDPVDLGTPRFVPGQPPEFNRNIVALGPGEYLLLALVAFGLYALATASISKQRCSEAPVLQLPGVAPKKTQRPSLLPELLARVSDLVRLPCPTGSPWRAELWLEVQRQVLPILLLSVLVALCVPLLISLVPTLPFPDADYIFPAAVFFIGIGIAVFNRRQASAGYMSAFEGTRGLSTLALASIQVAAVTVATLVGVLLTCVSVHFASGLAEAPGNLALRIQRTLALLQEGSLLFVLSFIIAQFVAFTAYVMLLASIHTWSVVWGRWIPYGAGILTIYAAAQAIRVSGGNATLEDIKQHLWAFGIVIFSLTLLALARTLYTKVLSLRILASALVIWGVFLACSLYGMAQQDAAFFTLAPEMQAYRGGLLVSPLLLFVLLLWSYDRLRHR